MGTEIWPRVRIALIAIIVVSLGIYLIPPPPPEGHIPHRIPVVFWHGFSGEWQPIYEGMVDRFNHSQSVYEVIPASIPDDSMGTKFLLSASGGATPDVILDWDPVLGVWADKGLIRPFDDIMSPEERREFLARTYPIVKRHATYRGKIMAMVDGLDMYAAYYRLDDLKEVGVDAKHLPKTLEELVSLGHRLDRYDSGHHLRRIGFLPTNVQNYVPLFGGKFNENGKIIIDTPKNLAAMRFIANSWHYYGFDEATRFAAGLSAGEGPSMPEIAGNYSILYDGEWRVSQITKYKPDLHYALAPIPPPRGGKLDASMSGPNYLMIPTAAKEPRGAWEFAKFCVGFLHPEEGGRHMGEMGWLPDDPIIAKSRSYQAYLRKNPTYKVFVNLMSSPNLEIPPQGPLQGFVTNELTNAEDAVKRGKLTPAEALQQVARHLADERARLKELGELPPGGVP